MVDPFDSSKQWIEFSPYSKALIVIVLIVLISAASYLIQHPPVNVNTYTARGGANNEIIFPCPISPPICTATGIFVVRNSQISHLVNVNATWSCNCNATVDMQYYPDIRDIYQNGTITHYHVLPAGENMTIFAQAWRYSGNDSITVNISTVVIL